VYDGEGVAETFSTDRYRLVLDLVEARPASLVAFLWRHQRDALVREAQRRGITHAVLDGSVPARMRADIVQRFQDGELQALFAHPATASHGLTLTRGVATIWCSPPDSSEQFIQMNHRLHRAGQPSGWRSSAWSRATRWRSGPTPSWAASSMPRPPYSTY
jgi:ATP-dependent helicase YprA (DUF1998 family)